MGSELNSPSATERFPPLITPVRLRERHDAYAHAMAHAADAGAGTLYHVGRYDLVEFAVVFEPDQPLAAARRVLFCGMNALAETIAAEALPERTVEFDYPGILLFDQGLIGGARLGWPEGCGEDEVPAFLIFAAMVRAGGFQELGFSMDRGSTSLEEAGFREIDGEAFAARFSRHLLVEIDEWQTKGFTGVGDRYLRRLRPGESDGVRRIDKRGDLAIHDTATGTRKVMDFAGEVQAARWLAQDGQGPRQ